MKNNQLFVRDQNNITIVKAVKKKAVHLYVEYKENHPECTNINKKTCGWIIHNDLIEAFDKLDEHLANLSFQYDKNGAIDVEAINADGFGYSGKEGEEKLELYGSRDLRDAFKILELKITHKIEGDHYDYKDHDELIALLEVCEVEVKKYLFEGKHAPVVNNMELPFENEDEMQVNVENGGTKKRGGGSKKIKETAKEEE